MDCFWRVSSHQEVERTMEATLDISAHFYCFYLNSMTPSHPQRDPWEGKIKINQKSQVSKVAITLKSHLFVAVESWNHEFHSSVLLKLSNASSWEQILHISPLKSTWKHLNELFTWINLCYLKRVRAKKSGVSQHLVWPIGDLRVCYN